MKKINNDKTIENSITELCEAVMSNKDGINNILELELKKLRILCDRIENGNIRVDNEKALFKEIKQLIDLLIFYEWVSKRKIDSIRELIGDVESRC